MSKGSNRRPCQVSDTEYRNRWDSIFGRDRESDNDDQVTTEKDEEVCGNIAKNEQTIAFDDKTTGA